MVAIVAVANGAWWLAQRFGADGLSSATSARNAAQRQEAPYDAMAALVLPFGYTLEEHFVQTEDGYILRLFRLGARTQQGPSTGQLLSPSRTAAPDPRPQSTDATLPEPATITTTTTSEPSDEARRRTAAEEQQPAAAGDPGGTSASTSTEVPEPTIATPTPNTGTGTGTSSAAAIAAAPSTGASTGARGPVAFLHHPLMGSSVDFAVMGPGRSLAFILADAGYDVWLTNVRGNRFSRNHTALDPDAPGDMEAFWSYSWDEHVSLDLPAALDLVAAVTGQDTGMLFVGYSQGTTVCLAALSSQPRVSRRIAAAVLLAPVAFVSHMTSPLFRWMAQWKLERLFRYVGMHEYGGHHPAAARLASSFCGRHPAPCTAYLELLCGTNPSPPSPASPYAGNLDPALLPAIMTFLPSGTSVQNMAHWGQVVRESDPVRLPYYDYGTDCSKPDPPDSSSSSSSLRTGGRYPCNQAAYNGSRVPPAYPLSSITTPLALFTGGRDSLADPVDVALLLSALQRGPGAEGGGPVVLLHHDEPDYGHLDFGVGYDAADRIYPLVLAFMRQFAAPGAGAATAAAAAAAA
ncbi:hypothetical protein PLESTM_001890400 [Pleodorina starrii]|nr:hypothetical protein PLESTM_001890400 [Pleodorina starrii]